MKWAVYYSFDCEHGFSVFEDWQDAADFADSLCDRCFGGSVAIIHTQSIEWVK